MQRVIHDRTCLIYFTGIKINTGTRVSCAVHIPSNCVINDSQMFAEKIHVPKRKKYAPLFEQRPCIKKTYRTVMKVRVNRVVFTSYSLSDFGDHIHTNIPFSNQRINAVKRLGIFGELPILHEFIPVQFAPSQDQFQLAEGQRSSDDITALDIDQGLVTGILGVKVRRMDSLFCRKARRLQRATGTLPRAAVSSTLR